MSTVELVRQAVNKSFLPVQKRHRGRRGYARIARLRLLVYQRIKKIGDDSKLHRHLKKNPKVARGFGFKKIPHRTQIGRWRRKHWTDLQKISERLAELVATPVKEIHRDSTELVDCHDSESEWGYCSKGFFFGFKVHSVVQQDGLPLRAIVTPGNVFDGTVGPELVDGLGVEPGCISTADAAYDDRNNRAADLWIGAVSAIPLNQRRSKKRLHMPKKLRLVYSKLHYKAEQLNSLLKETLDCAWQRFEGLAAKRGLIYAQIIAILACALENKLNGNALRQVNHYWF